MTAPDTTAPEWAARLLPAESERFYRKCIPEPNTGCWLWEFGVCKDGYGKFQVTNTEPRPKQFHVRAHRASHFIATGEWPAVVRHHCDNPACVNPVHLAGGTHEDNIRDMDARGRRRAKGVPHPGARGERHHATTITNEQATEVKRLLAAKVSGAEVARQTGVSLSTVYNISHGKTWAWLA